LKGAVLGASLPVLASIALDMETNATDEKDIHLLNSKYQDMKKEWETVKGILSEL